MSYVNANLINKEELRSLLAKGFIFYKGFKKIKHPSSNGEFLPKIDNLSEIKKFSADVNPSLFPGFTKFSLWAEGDCFAIATFAGFFDEVTGYPFFTSHVSREPFTCDQFILDGSIEVDWSGGKCPIGDQEAKIAVHCRNGVSSLGTVKDFKWAHRNCGFDIVKYKIISEIIKEDAGSADAAFVLGVDWKLN